MIEVTKVVEYGYIAYYRKGTRTFHREDGPAAIWTSGRQEWYFCGRLHRDDGPAVMYYDDDGPLEWWLDGMPYSREAWFEALPEDKKINMLYSEYFIRG